MTKPMNAKPKTLVQAIKYFSDPANCREYLVAIRWPDGVSCPSCGSQKVYFDSSRNGWECATRHPHRKFTLKTGTIMEDSPIGLDKWLPTFWMIANMKNGVSSHELARSLGVTQKTAWFLLHRVRLSMQDQTGGMLSGTVEVDETYIGGKARNMHASKREAAMNRPGRTHFGKVAVMGLLERHSSNDKPAKIRTKLLHTVKGPEVQAMVRANVEEGSTVNTDALHSYHGLMADYVHNVIDHAEAYVADEVHTNTVENFWSCLKRGLHGTYISVEPFHLFRYLDEQAFRWNNRRGFDDAARFDLVLSGIVGRRLTYKDLIGAQNAPNGN
jgi:transposase-like protein